MITTEPPSGIVLQLGTGKPFSFSDNHVSSLAIPTHHAASTRYLGGGEVPASNQLANQETVNTVGGDDLGTTASKADI